MENLIEEYRRLISLQVFNEADLDYSLLEKPDVGNSMEAVKYASALGLLN